MTGASGADVRAKLREAGLRVIQMREVHSKRSQRAERDSEDRLSFRERLRALWHRHLRDRRRDARAELLDGLATLLDSGLPLMESLSTLTQAGQDRSLRRLQSAMHDALKDGASLAGAMGDQPDWFEPVDVAIVRAGEHAGTLPTILRTLAQRQEGQRVLMQRIIGALTYPVCLTCVGLGVVLFLSHQTLPVLVAVLDQSDVATPQLTVWVIGFGETVMGAWWALPLLAIAIGCMWIFGGRWMKVQVARRPHLARWMPRIWRQLLVGRFTQQFAELNRVGVPIVEAIGVLAPTTPSRFLRQRLIAAGSAIERGETLAEAFGDRWWFDIEFTRLLDIGQAGGDLDEMMARLADRYQRRCLRLIDRLAGMLEPVSILILAALIGVVVMAAILPLIRLQEVL